MKRWILVGGGMAVLLLLLALGAFLLAGRSGREPREHSAHPEPREVRIPGARILLPDVEEELLNPGLRYAVDPTKPLDLDLLSDREGELLRAVWDELLSRVEKEVEELLFD
ncbi:MAG: hypothetical protein EA427_07125 [Spirochaetaceae bacterium]|nr:MAG: hypothetical protein EA427_07125 [Spirochaetaceae bacterium]